MTYWCSRRVAVTGGAGFLGTALTRLLAERGATDIFVPRSADYDLRDQQATRRMFRDARPDVLVHLAAVVGGIGANQQNPGKFFYDSAIMGLHVIEQARLAGVEKLVLIGTVCSYPAHAPTPFKETDLWQGYPEPTNAPYGLAKRMLLVQAQAYRQQYGLNSIYLLPVNLYGPGDNFDPATSHVIPALIKKHVEAREAGQKEVVVWGTGTPTREFLYVDDLADACVFLMQQDEETLSRAVDGSASVINVGSGRDIGILELARLIADIGGHRQEPILDPSRADGIPRRLLDTSRISRLGWKPRVSLEDGIRLTYDWYRKAGSVVAD